MTETDFRFRAIKLIKNLNWRVVDLFKKCNRLEVALQDAPDVGAQQLLDLGAHGRRDIQALDRLQRLGLEEAQQLEGAQADSCGRSIGGRAARAEHAAARQAESV